MAETDEKVDRILQENAVTTRRLEWATTTALDADKKVDGLENRVTNIEEKLAV